MDRLESDRHPLAITTAEAIATNGNNPWNWRDTTTNGTISLPGNNPWVFSSNCQFLVYYNCNHGVVG
jgi:hypothetical protein